VTGTARLEIVQQLVMDGQGFQATLALENGNSTISDLDIDITISDASGDRTSDFYIEVKTALPEDLPGNHGALGEWFIVPTNVHVINLEGEQFWVAATMTYTLDGVTHVVYLLPQQITIYPPPELDILYDACAEL
jgi:hypothetical protein